MLKTMKSILYIVNVGREGSRNPSRLEGNKNFCNVVRMRRPAEYTASQGSRTGVACGESSHSYISNVGGDVGFPELHHLFKVSQLQ